MAAVTNCGCVGVLSCSVMSDSLWPQGLQYARLLCPCNFPGENTGAGYHFLLQGIFPTQRLNTPLLCLLHRQVDSLLLRHLGSPHFFFSSSSRIQSSKIRFTGLKSKCCHSWRFWRENIFSCLFFLLVAACIPWFVAPSYEQSILLQTLLLSYYLFLLFHVNSVCFLLVMTIVITFRAHWHNPR